MDALRNDLTVAMRQLWRQRGFTLTVVLTLGLAIGANLAVFSVVHAVLFGALPYGDPERLVWITSVRSDNPAGPFTLPEFMDYRSQVRTLSGLAAYANWRASLTGGQITEGLQGARMSGNAFDVLGLRPVVGRLLRESDDRPDSPKVALLSYRLWQRRFGRAATVVGSSVRLNGESYVIAGVLPRHFPLPLRDIDVVIPLVPNADPNRYVRNSVNFLSLFGRLDPGVRAIQAQTELTKVCRSLRQQFPVEYARKQAVGIVPLKEALIAGFRQSMLVLFAAVSAVLAAALANLVSLVLVRAGERQAEVSIRIAMGASRWHLARQQSVESFVLAVIGAGLGWALAHLAISIAVPWAPQSIPRLGEVSVDSSVLGFAAFLTVLVTGLLSAASLGTVIRAHAADALHSVTRGSLGNRWSARVRQVLVTSEIFAAVVLLLTTTVLLENINRLQHVQSGFRPDSVFQARISIPPLYKSPADVGRFYDRLYGSLARLPGVQYVGVTNVAPLSGLLFTAPFRVDGEDQRDLSLPNVNLRIVSPGFLSAVGTHLVNGRQFRESDRAEHPNVALVSSAFAARFLNDAPLGRRVFINDNNQGPRPVEVVGVVEDVRQAALDAPPAFDVYIPLRQMHPDSLVYFRNNQFWMIRTASAPAALRSSFLSQLRIADPDAAVSSAGTMRDYVEAALGPRRFNLGLYAAFSLTGVVIAVVGVYGLVSYSVSKRQREIGLRMAMGATEIDIRRMILRQAAILGLTGAGPACCLAGVAQPLLARLVREATIAVPSAIGISGILLALVMLAAWFPASRAARVQPTVALRGE